VPLQASGAPSPHASLVRALRAALRAGGAAQAAALRALGALLREGVAQPGARAAEVARAYAAALCSDVLATLGGGGGGGGTVDGRRLAVGAALLLTELAEPAEALGALFALLVPPLLGCHGVDAPTDSLILQARPRACARREGESARGRERASERARERARGPERESTRARARVRDTRASDGEQDSPARAILRRTLERSHAQTHPRAARVSRRAARAPSPRRARRLSLARQALLHLGKKGAGEFRATVAQLGADDRARLQAALGGGAPKPAASAAASAASAAGAAASAAAEAPKIALKMDFSSFGGPPRPAAA
jgi:hypothetical protein